MKGIYKVIFGTGLVLGSLGFLVKNHYDYVNKKKEITKKEALKNIGAGLTGVAGIVLYSRELLKDKNNLEGDLKE